MKRLFFWIVRVDGCNWSGTPGCVLNVAERTCTLYLADFVTFEGDRYYVSADLRTGKIKLERVSHEAFERFITNILTMPDPLAETSNKEVLA